jgi:transcriptional regulator with XRE-family HTH domain
MSDIGQTLREARMRARIDMSEVETRTKIRARYLRAIENEEWDLLPGPVYIKSFLRTYADYLGLDSRLLVDEFKREYERPSDHELHAAPTMRRDRDRDRDRPPRHPRGPLIPPWLVILVVLVGVVAALYLIGSGGGRRPTPTGSHTGTHHARHKTTKPVHHVHHKPKLARVKLVVTSPVYICVENRAGHVLLPAATYNPGQTIPLLKSRQVFLTLGNNGVTMTANGKRYAVAASASAIGLKVTTKGVSTLAPGHSPTCGAG